MIREVCKAVRDDWKTFLIGHFCDVEWYLANPRHLPRMRTHKWLTMYHNIDSPAHIRFIWKVRVCAHCRQAKTLKFERRESIGE